MKFVFSKASALFLVAAALFMAGCGSSPAEMVIGQWRISNMDMGEIPEENRAMFEDMMKKVKETSVMDIKEDGTFMQTMEMERKVESGGKWIMSEDGKVFVTTSDKSGMVDSLDVEELTANTFVVSAVDQGQKITISYSK